MIICLVFIDMQDLQFLLHIHNSHFHLSFYHSSNLTCICHFLHIRLVQPTRFSCPVRQDPQDNRCIRFRYHRTRSSIKELHLSFHTNSNISYKYCQLLCLSVIFHHHSCYQISWQDECNSLLVFFVFSCGHLDIDVHRNR